MQCVSCRPQISKKVLATRAASRDTPVSFHNHVIGVSDDYRKTDLSAYFICWDNDDGAYKR